LILDVNVLVAVFRDDAAGHAHVRPWLERQLASEQLLMLPDSSVVGFVRVVTHPRIFTPASSLNEAIGFVDALLATGRCVVPGTDERHWAAFRDQLLAGDARGDLVPDAHLAALAVRHGVAVATRDRDFARFPGVRIVDPLAA
jgi:toxin-antitoxin system PIN domain toxin